MSCAHQKNGSDKNHQEILDKEIAKVCLDAEGKARLEIGSNKYLFNFESVLKSEEASWMMAAHIPLQGEELLGINYQAGQDSKVLGNFLNKMRNQAEQNGQKNKSTLTVADYKLAFSKFGQILFFLDEVRKERKVLTHLCQHTESEMNTQSYSCFVSKERTDHFKVYLNSNELIFKQELSIEKHLEFSFSSPSQTNFEKIQLSFKGQRQKFELIFFLSACTQGFRGEP